jgi:hypothetical protein
MTFVGFDSIWIEWFRKYLEAPLNMDNAGCSDGRTPKGPITRRRGVPMAHGPEKFLGELILYFLDVAVFRKTGLYLLRLHDDIWIHGPPVKVAEAWKTMQDIAKILGLAFNFNKTGSVYLKSSDAKDEKVAALLPNGPVVIGFLELNESSGEWDINQEAVSVHVQQLKHQLSECSSVLSWIQTWNSCIGEKTRPS